MAKAKFKKKHMKRLAKYLAAAVGGVLVDRVMEVVGKRIGKSEAVRKLGQSLQPSSN